MVLSGEGLGEISFWMAHRQPDSSVSSSPAKCEWTSSNNGDGGRVPFQNHTLSRAHGAPSLPFYLALSLPVAPLLTVVPSTSNMRSFALSERSRISLSNPLSLRPTTDKTVTRVKNCKDLYFSLYPQIFFPLLCIGYDIHLCLPKCPENLYRKCKRSSVQLK